MRHTPYELELESLVGPGPDIYTFRSADGVLSKDEFRRSELLLLNASERGIGRDDSVLNMDANYGVVGTVLRDLSGEVVMTETSARCSQLCEINLEINERDTGENVEVTKERETDASVVLTPEVGNINEDEFDVVVYAPKPYDPVGVVKQKIHDGLEKLRVGGEFFLSAEKDEGGPRYRDTLKELGGNVEWIEKSGGCYVYSSIKEFETPEKEYVKEREFTASVPVQNECNFVTRPGLFSSNKLDDGTRMLIEEILEDGVREEDDFLDLACGYGAVGVFVSKASGCSTWYTDDDCVATKYAETNVERNDIEYEKVVPGDCLDGVDEEKFDLVATNPPTHAGSDVIDEMFEGAHEVLREGGRFYVVYNGILNYEDDLEFFDSVEVVREEKKYKVAVARK